MNAEVIAVFSLFYAYCVVYILCVSTIYGKYRNVTQIKALCYFFFADISAANRFCLSLSLGRKINRDIVLYKICVGAVFGVVRTSKHVYYINGMLGVMFAALSDREQHLVTLVYVVADLNNSQRRAAQSIGQNHKILSLSDYYTGKQLGRLLQYRKHDSSCTARFGLFGNLLCDDHISGYSSHKRAAAYKCVLACEKICNKSEGARERCNSASKHLSHIADIKLFFFCFKKNFVSE